MKMEAVHSTETLVPKQHNTWRIIPENKEINLHHRAYLKPGIAHIYVSLQITAIL
jgi:hypothetical protein